MSTKLRWGILSTGNIAKAFAGALPGAERGELAGVASRSLDKAEAFTGKFGGRAFGTYEALLADDGIDAVYVATPHPQHAAWSIKACRAGKHVLCEKPIGVNRSQASAIFEAAESAGVFVMEAYMYRCHPQAAKLVELIRQGAVGEVQLIETTFSFRAGGDEPDWQNGRLFSPDLAGGGILDVGGYVTTVSNLIAGAALGKTVLAPKDLVGHGKVSDNGIDEYAVATLRYEGGIVANVTCGVRLNLGQRLVVHGSKGKLSVDTPFTPARDGGEAILRLNDEPIVVTSDKPLYAHEADVFAQGVEQGEAPFPAMTREATLANMGTLDHWRRKVMKVTYPFETVGGFPKTTVAGEPLAVRDDAAVDRVQVGGVEVSRFVIGCDNQPDITHGAIMWDAFWEQGGNTFDTAHIYGGGKQLELLGAWLANRGVRDQARVICKGVHTPQNHPEHLRPQLERDLERLGSDYCDFYFCHRDNRDVPVGEWVDLLNELADSGMIRHGFGGSNWDLDRVQAFGDFAKTNGKRPMTAVSMNLSLARMVDPVWKGVQSAKSEDWLAWLKETGTPNFAWSSQARGFFVPERDLEEAEINRCWVSEDNLERRRRCFELAEQKGVLPVNIAAAWVLRQPFPSLAIIGPRELPELRTSLPGLGIELSEAEHAWLNLERDTLAA
jgi:predicted dehydrogenase/aryl-alcohol dehydrogenase-like predicted oxidoreductase